MFHRYEGRDRLSARPHPTFWLDSIGHSRVPAVVQRLLKPVKSKELALLFHLCVAVTDKGRHGDDNELPRYHQTVITMVTAALCCCQSFSLIIPQQIPKFYTHIQGHLLKKELKTDK